MGQTLSSQQATTADGIADQHEYWRQQASEHAQRRGHLLQQSQQAYQAGRGQDAHQLSLQGKEEGRLMEEANRKASEAVFHANNLSSEADVIDLHGLYVKEAEKVTSQRIDQAIAGKRMHLVVIVGQGHHSKDGIQHLKPAIETLAQQRGLPCTYGKPRQAACGWTYLSLRFCGLWQPFCAGLCPAYEATSLEACQWIYFPYHDR